MLPRNHPRCSAIAPQASRPDKPSHASCCSGKLAIATPEAHVRLAALAVSGSSGRRRVSKRGRLLASRRVFSLFFSCSGSARVELGRGPGSWWEGPWGAEAWLYISWLYRGPLLHHPRLLRMAVMPEVQRECGCRPAPGASTRRSRARVGCRCRPRPMSPPVCTTKQQQQQQQAMCSRHLCEHTSNAWHDR